MKVIRDYHLENLLTDEVRELVPDVVRRVIVPCGALEAHGAIGLGTDTIIPIGFAEALAPRLNALIAPALPLGTLRTLKRYPGSIGLSPALYLDLLKEIGDGLVQSGFDEIILLNGHAGNTATLKDAAYHLHVEHGVFALAYDWYFEPDQLAVDIYGGGGGHSAAAETGLVVAFRPDAAPEGLWKREDAGVPKPSVSAYPAPYPIMLIEEDNGLPDFDQNKAKRFAKGAIENAAKSLAEVLDRWETLHR
ncbi:creatininase family protein [bacterium]|nr:creatininase family protein [bacterium]